MNDLPHDENLHPPRRWWLVAGIAVALAALWMALGLDLTRAYSPTVDEVPHAASGWAMRVAHDFRVNPEHPPLWKLVSAIPHSSDALKRDLSSPLWLALVTRYDFEWMWAAELLYEDDPMRGVAYIKRSRRMSLLFGLLLGGITIFWSWRLGGPYAAALAATLFLFEPNLLAHSALVTSDIPFTTMFLLTSILMATRVRSRLKYVSALGIGMALGLALASKFSALLLAPIAALLILVRPYFREHQETPEIRRTSPNVLIELLVVAVVAYAVLWGSYGFRFSPVPDGRLLDVSRALGFLEFKATHTGETAGGLVVSAALFAEKLALLPQAFCVGLIWAKATTLGMPAFLLGELSHTGGWWYYFPVALALKLPSALILAMITAVLLGWRNRRDLRLDRWELICLLFPPIALLLVSLGSNLNIGIRHVFPVVPAVIVLSATVIAAAIRGRNFRLSILTVLLIFGAVETASIHPHQLSYFNLFSGGWQRGIHLLAESNLDWGQDLERLADWTRARPCTKVHLAYSGTTRPEVFGIEFEKMPTRGPASALPPLKTEADEVLIVNTHYLQGLDVGEELLPFYTMLRHLEPDEIIGTTLHVYRIGPQASCAGG